ncbi:hypothetical protein BaRGS_00002393 [Batillaria attramentaria]|uniref:Dynactin subunit 4 n=1 Tax=Batillaria attramentaria TaxID=370345 RepID=A0ABD0M4L3_9CAEN
MATFMDVNLVRYLCSCGKRYPACRLYLCRHCLKLRCSDCVQHEVDSPYCPNCLENMPASEAKLKKNRCSNCFDCPICGHTLMTRATSQMMANPDDPGKSTPKKMYYMACSFCRWTTRDVGLPDRVVANGGWPDEDNADAKRINTLLESYRAVAQREKAEKERKKYVKRRSHAGFQDKYGLTSVAMKWKIQPAVANLSIKEKENEKVPSPPQMVEPVTDFDPLPPEIFTEPVQLEKVTHLTHRLAAPEFQPAETVDLRPIHKHLLVRRSLRCRECEHNLSKPDFNPLSIKFKIQLIALNHIPELRIMSPATFTPNKETVVTFTLSNPSVYNTVVKLLPIEGETDTDYMTAKIELPKADLVLAHHDDTAVYDDSSKISPEFKDDPRVIVFRRANKLGFVAKVTPICKSGDVKVSFQMKHEFRNTAAAIQSEDKEPKLEWLQQQVFVRLGRIGQ